MPPTITKIKSIEFAVPLVDIGYAPNGFSVVYEPGRTSERRIFALRVETDSGVTGEYVGGNSPAAAQLNMFAHYLIGKNALDREAHWSALKRAMRKYDWMGMGPIDIALWDLAGKHYDAPIHELLGTYRRRFPAYASTYQGDRHGGLDEPNDYADFAEYCLSIGYDGFKIHDWGGDWTDVKRTVETIHAVGNRVGAEMDLMIDPACNPPTFADALRIGRACDEQQFFWLEDPYRDGGVSQHGHRRLGSLIETPLLLTEHIRGLEPHTDFAVNEATDFLRADPEYDGGITGVMKIAHVAEGLGLDVELHAPGPAQRHCIAAIRNTNYYEMALVHPKCENTTPPVYADEYDDRLESLDDDGLISVPERPGLGVTYDWDYIFDNETGRRVYEA